MARHGNASDYIRTRGGQKHQRRNRDNVPSGVPDDEASVQLSTIASVISHAFSPCASRDNDTHEESVSENVRQ
jgi:hypothetical protein